MYGCAPGENNMVFVAEPIRRAHGRGGNIVLQPACRKAKATFVRFIGDAQVVGCLFRPEPPRVSYQISSAGGDRRRVPITSTFFCRRRCEQGLRDHDPDSRPAVSAVPTTASWYRQ